MSGKWVYSKVNTLEALADDWLHKATGMPRCTPDLPQVVTMHVKVPKFKKPSIQMLCTAVKNMLRAPWNTMSFKLVDNQGKDVYDGEEQVDQNYFKRWYAGTVGDTATAWARKPSTFVDDRRVLRINEVDYTSDVFSPLFEAVGKPIHPRVTIEPYTHALDWNKCIGLEVIPTMQLRDLNGKITQFPAGRQWTSFEDFSSLGFAPLMEETMSEAWDSTHRIYVSAESDNFDTDVNQLVGFLKHISTRGLNIPCDFRNLPDARQIQSITLRTTIHMYVTTLMRPDTSVMQFKLPIGDPDPETPANRLTGAHLDWSPFLGDDQAHNSCLALYHVASRLHLSDPLFEPALHVLHKVRDVVEAIHRVAHGTHHEVHDLRDAADHAAEEGEEVGHLLRHKNNGQLHRSEGYLRLVTLIGTAERLATDMGERGLATSSQVKQWNSQLRSIDLVELKQQAVTKGIYNDAYAHPDRKRPLHEHEMARDLQAAEERGALQERMSNPTFPVWGRAMLATLGILTAFTLVWLFIRMYYN